MILSGPSAWPAEELQSPVILAHYVSTGEYSGHDWFYETAKWMAEKVSVPVAIHLDHGDSFERCMEMLHLGFTSIMYDGSNYPVEENARRTEEVAKVCRAFHVPLEAEIGGELEAVESYLTEVFDQGVIGAYPVQGGRIQIEEDASPEEYQAHIRVTDTQGNLIPNQEMSYYIDSD